MKNVLRKAVCVEFNKQWFLFRPELKNQGIESQKLPLAFNRESIFTYFVMILSSRYMFNMYNGHGQWSFFKNVRSDNELSVVKKLL